MTRYNKCNYEHSSESECEKYDSKRCKRGKRGYPGFQGPTGPSGSFQTNQGSFYSGVDQPIQALNTPQPVSFEIPYITNGVNYLNNFNTFQIEVLNSGIYYISSNLVFQNNNEIPVNVFLSLVVRTLGDNYPQNFAITIPANGYYTFQYGAQWELNSDDYVLFQWRSNLDNVLIVGTEDYEPSLDILQVGTLSS